MCVKGSNCRVGRAERSGAKPTDLGNGGFSFAGLRLRYAPTHPTSKKMYLT